MTFRAMAVERSKNPAIVRARRREPRAPLLRLAAYAGAGAADQARSALLAPFSSPAARARRRQADALRAVERAVGHLGALKGAFAKLGQFAATRHDVLPAAATDALARLRDRVPPLPFAEIRAVVERDLGAPLEQRFARFEPAVLGAASLAQVHHATLRDGSEVAVKVQYPWLERSLAADVRLLRRCARWVLAGRRRKLPDLERFFDEFESGLREELDFAREARVAEEIARNLAGDDRVRVPEVVASHSTRRVLTVRYQAGVALTDVSGLDRLGVDRRALLEVVTRAYAVQVFVDGLFHADPHPGNLFVLEEPGAAEKPRVLFVDFGLARRLGPELRSEIRTGLHALLRRDVAGFVAAMQRQRMIAPGCESAVRDAIEAMMARLAEAGGALGLSSSAVLPLKDEAKRLLQETPGLQLPQDLLLFARTLSTLFALGRELAPDADLMKLVLPYLFRFLSSGDARAAVPADG